jgi:hypothetical protein
MSLPAHEATSAAPSRSNGHVGRIVRLGLIGLAFVPFVLGDRLGLAASTQSITVQATADAQVRSHFPDRNYGTGVRLRTRVMAGDHQRTLIRFTIPTVKDKITAVQLRLFVRDRSIKGGEIHQVVGPWSETTVTWAKAPLIAPAVIGRIGSTGQIGRWITVPLNLTGLKSGKKVDLEIVGVSADGALYASRETGRGPALLLTVAAPAAATPKPPAKPTADPNGAGGAAPTPTADPTGTPGATPTATAHATPTATVGPTSTPAPTSAPTSDPGPKSPSVGIVVSKSELAALPMSGADWTNLKSWADASAGSPDIQNQDEDNDIHVLAKALVYARTGSASYRVDVVANLKSAIGSESGGRTLAAGRNLPGYVIAADLIDLGSYDPTFDKNTFRPWLRRVLTEDLSGDTLISTHEDRPNNWGTHAGAARAAIARYLGDSAQLARTAAVFHGWLGDRTAYTGFSFGDTSWQCDPAKPVGVNPKGCSKGGHVIDGALPDDMRRGGSFQWPPAFTNYAWEAMQGATLEALILDRAGYDAFGWEDKALLRAATFLYDRVGWTPSSDDTWQPWLLNHAYGTNLPAQSPAHAGKNFAFTDWLYGK